jgi:integrase
MLLATVGVGTADAGARYARLQGQPVRAAATKNGEERVLVLNRIAQAILERQRGKHPEMVWTYEGEPLGDLNTTAWINGRARAAKRYKEVLGRECPNGFRTLHVHDWRHTFGRRLRAAGVSKETRSALLGHSDGGDMTTHYSAAEILELVNAVRKIEAPLGSVPTLTVIRAQAA